MGSTRQVEDLVAAGQRAADKLTSERFAQMEKDHESAIKMLEMEKQKTAEYHCIGPSSQCGCIRHGLRNVDHAAHMQLRLVS